MTLGDKLKRLRKSKKINQKEVAEYLGFGVSTYSQYENNLRRPDYKTLSKIRKLFDAPYEFLLDDYFSDEYDDWDHDFVDEEIMLMRFGDVLKRSRRFMTRIDAIDDSETEELKYLVEALADLYREYVGIVEEFNEVHNTTDLHDRFLQYLNNPRHK